ncbi:uncharacterized protein LOC132947105 [Metopolophium dirhodum]|uniref:uncharacterized protein LOC132947105 n=1 Tax=Metopolophium dirhodum TaxID=44670 RepID=UPI00298F5CB2|nr:uncharacterized protein LOC132947105 [Metopolophium dirhodum]
MTTYIYNYGGGRRGGGGRGGGGRGGRGGAGGGKTPNRNKCPVCFKRGHTAAQCRAVDAAATRDPVAEAAEAAIAYARKLQEEAALAAREQQRNQPPPPPQQQQQEQPPQQQQEQEEQHINM